MVPSDLVPSTSFFFSIGMIPDDLTWTELFKFRFDRVFLDGHLSLNVLKLGEVSSEKMPPNAKACCTCLDGEFFLTLTQYRKLIPDFEVQSSPHSSCSSSSIARSIKFRSSCDASPNGISLYPKGLPISSAMDAA